MKSMIVIISVLFLGCVEPIEFHIDRNCSTEERVAAIESFKAMNEVLGYEHAVIVGSAEVDYELESELGGNRVVMCVPDEQTAELFDGTEDSGWYQPDGGLAVRSDKTTDRYGVWSFQRVLMHELIHLIGANNSEHSDNPNDIFYEFFIPIESIEYTDADKKIIQKYSIL